MNQLDLQNRHAVITGGGSGIGLAIAQRMVASGARLTLWDINDASLRSAQNLLGRDVNTVVMNVADHTDVARAATQSEQHAPVDILVNSAGITGPNMAVVDYPLADWQLVMDVNLNGLFYCCRAVVPGMRARNYGRIVNMASVAGKEGNPNASAYSASKAAVIALTKSLGKELATTGVRVNCVAPAAVKTPIFEQMTPEFTLFMLSKIPMGRFGEVNEVAAMVAWLCTEECSFSTGAAFDISGGRATY
jgi:2-dehydro-3-deoxy-L-rhamnonate dehydrogenase (NAD+)